MLSLNTSHLQAERMREALIVANTNRTRRFVAILAFLFGLGLLINVRIGVRLSVTELFSPFVFVALSGGLNKLLQNTIIRNAIFFLILHILAVIISDFVGSVPRMDFLKGLARPVFILGLLINIGLILIQDPRLIAIIWAGIFCGTLLHLVANTAGDPYDFELQSMEYAFYVFRVTPVVMFGASLAAFYIYPYFRVGALLVMIAGAVFVIAYAGRSSTFTWFVSCCVFAYAVFGTNFDARGILNPGRRMLTFFAIFGVLAFASYYFYKELATRGFMRDTKKNQGNLKELSNDFGYGPIGLLVAGRAESIASLLMIYDSPIFGHGTTSMGGEYFLRAFSLSGQKKKSESEIPGILYGRVGGGHSILLQQWAANGILTVPFWTFVLYQILKLGTILTIARDRYIALLAILLTTMVFDIFFSPCSVLMRCYTPMMISFSAFYLPEIIQRARRTLYLSTAFSPVYPAKKPLFLPPMAPR